jgi:hypothetical protein
MGNILIEDPVITIIAEFPNRSFVIHLVYIYLGSSVGVGCLVLFIIDGKRTLSFFEEPRPVLRIF